MQFPQMLWFTGSRLAFAEYKYLCTRWDRFLWGNTLGILNLETWTISFSTAFLEQKTGHLSQLRAACPPASPLKYVLSLHLTPQYFIFHYMPRLSSEISDPDSSHCFSPPEVRALFFLFGKRSSIPSCGWRDRKRLVDCLTHVSSVPRVYLLHSWALLLVKTFY